MDERFIVDIEVKGVVALCAMTGKNEGAFCRINIAGMFFAEIQQLIGGHDLLGNDRSIFHGTAFEPAPESFLVSAEFHQLQTGEGIEFLMRVQGNGGIGHICLRVVRVGGDIGIDRGDLGFAVQLFDFHKVQQSSVFLLSGKEFFCFVIPAFLRQDRQIDLAFTGKFQCNCPDFRDIAAGQPHCHDQVPHQGIFFRQFPQFFFRFLRQTVKHIIHEIAAEKFVTAAIVAAPDIHVIGPTPYFLRRIIHCIDAQIPVVLQDPVLQRTFLRDGRQIIIPNAIQLAERQHTALGIPAAGIQRFQRLCNVLRQVRTPVFQLTEKCVIDRDRGVKAVFQGKSQQFFPVFRHFFMFFALCHLSGSACIKFKLKQFRVRSGNDLPRMAVSAVTGILDERIQFFFRDVQIFSLHFMSDLIPPGLNHPVIRGILPFRQFLTGFREIQFCDPHNMGIHVHVREAGHIAMVDQTGGNFRVEKHCSCSCKRCKYFFLHCLYPFYFLRRKRERQPERFRQPGYPFSVLHGSLA